MSELPTISREEARDRILSNQGLLVPSSNGLDAVKTCLAVQTQYAASLPIATAARTKKPRAGWEQAALQHGKLVKAWTLRQTIHTQAPEDYQAMIEAFGPARRARYENWMRGSLGIEGRALEALEGKLLDALAQGPLTRKQLHERVPDYKGMPMVGWGLDLMGLSFLGKVVLLTPDKGATLFKRTEPPDIVRPPNEAIGFLAVRYFAAYGPATIHDLASWLGSAMKPLPAAIESVRDRLVAVRVEGVPGEHFISADAPPAPPAKGVRLLAKFDPLVMGYRRRSLFLSPDHHKAVFRPAGQVEATVLENGSIVGTWRLSRMGSKGCLTIYPFAARPIRNRSEVARQVERVRLATGLTGIELEIA